jgi:hypothetical protein
MIRIGTGLALAAGAVLTTGCQADREVFDQGATMEAPAEVQEAPAWPQEPQPIGPATTTDTAVLDTLGQRGTTGHADTLGSPQPIRP